MLKAGNLNFTASGPVLSALPASGDRPAVYLDLQRWNPILDEMDFEGRFTDWQLVHTDASGIEHPILSMGSFDIGKGAPVVGSA